VICRKHVNGCYRDYLFAGIKRYIIGFWGNRHESISVHIRKMKKRPLNTRTPDSGFLIGAVKRKFLLDLFHTNPLPGHSVAGVIICRMHEVVASLHQI